MGKINYYKEKYLALVAFYGWVDKGNDYNMAVELALQHNTKNDLMEEIILNITIATRFARCDKEIAEKFRSKLCTIVEKAKQINVDDYGLTDGEKEEFYDELNEVELEIGI